MSTVTIQIRHSGQFDEGVSLQEIVLVNTKGLTLRTRHRGLYRSVKEAKSSEEFLHVQQWLKGAGLETVTRISRKKIKLLA